MKTLSFLLIFFFSFSIDYAIAGNVCISSLIEIDHEQDEPKTNQVDENGRKQGFWIYLGKDQPEKGYPDDGKIAEGPFLNDRRNGHWIMYYEDGLTPKTEGNFVNNRPNGSYMKYHPNGVIKEVGTYSKRSYIDSLKRFNEKGILIYEGKYDEYGKEFGTVKYFYDNGTPEFIYEAKNGVPQGKATRYWPNGDVKEELVFSEEGSLVSTSGEIEPVNPIVEEKVIVKDAKLAPRPSGVSEFNSNGYNKLFNSNQELWMEGEFKDGLLFDGRLYIYDEHGLLLKIEVYKEGIYHSDGQL